MLTLPPGLRARLRDLRLGARRATAAGGIGLHASRNRGAGLEFAQYRGYEPGDEPRRIDWKLFARSDRYFVRESERDSPLRIWIVVDASASMTQADAARPDYDKLAAARLLAACVIDVAVRQGDRFGLIVLSEAAPRLVEVEAGTRQRDRCLFELERIEAVGVLPDAARQRPLWERVRAGDLVLMLSDFFDDALAELAERLAVAQRDVLAIQLLSVGERDFPFDGGPRFRDPETGAERAIDARALRADFLVRFGAAQAALAARFAAAGVRHATSVLDESPDLALRRLFGTRAGHEAA